MKDEARSNETFAGAMVQVLLNVTGFPAPAFAGEFLHSFFTHFPVPEIKFPHHAPNPDVHGKRLVFLKSKQQYAISDLRPHARKPDQFCFCLVII